MFCPVTESLLNILKSKKLFYWKLLSVYYFFIICWNTISKQENTHAYMYTQNCLSGIRYLNCIMTKPTKWVCAQRRLRSAWASAQSSESLLSSWRNIGPLPTHWAHRLGRCPGWSETLLGAHSFCWFCHVVAPVFTYCFCEVYTICSCTCIL